MSDANDENGARQYAMKKITVQQKIDTLKDTIEEFKKAKDQQDEIRKAVKQELDELKEEKERTIYQMEADQQIIQLHEGMNASASSSESDHMLERVREGAKRPENVQPERRLPMIQVQKHRIVDWKPRQETERLMNFWQK